MNLLLHIKDDLIRCFIQRKYSDDAWNNNYDNTSDWEFTDEQLDLVVEEDPDVVLAHYRVATQSQNTNEVSFYVHELKMDKIGNNNLISSSYKLNQNYPNPFNPKTSITFSIAKDNFVSIKVYDILGKEIKVLHNEFKKQGTHNIEFNAGSLPSGVYFYQITAGKFIDVKKMQLLK